LVFINKFDAANVVRLSGRSITSKICDLHLLLVLLTTI